MSLKYIGIHNRHGPAYDAHRIYISTAYLFTQKRASYIQDTSVQSLGDTHRSYIHRVDFPF